MFDLGHIELAKQLVSEDLVASPPWFQLCLGIPWGAPANPGRNAGDARHVAERGGLVRLWNFADAVSHGCASGDPRGHARVGLEDNLYLDAGKLAPNNAALVERAVAAITAIGMDVATPADARNILGPGRNN